MQPLRNRSNDFNTRYSKHKDPAGFMAPLKINKDSWVSSTLAQSTVLIGDLSQKKGQEEGEGGIMEEWERKGKVMVEELTATTGERKWSTAVTKQFLSKLW